MKNSEKLQVIRSKLEEIVCTEGCDRGVVLLSQEGSTHYDPELKVNVYDHENFSPLGDALIELYDLIKEVETGVKEEDSLFGESDCQIPSFPCKVEGCQFHTKTEGTLCFSCAEQKARRNYD